MKYCVNFDKRYPAYSRNGGWEAEILLFGEGYTSTSMPVPKSEVEVYRRKERQADKKRRRRKS